MKTLFTLFALLFTLPVLQAQELSIAGVHNGKNLYLYNPVSSGSSCISAIYVNGNPVKVANASAIEIDLTHLKPRQSVEVKVLHGESCKPKFLNPNVIRPTLDFQFGFSEVTGGSIEWVARGEKNGSRFFIETFRQNTWVTEKTMSCNSGSGNNRYTVPVQHSAGSNLYRIKYMNGTTGETQYSRVMEFESARKVAEVQFAGDFIRFSMPVNYEVVDIQYNTVLKGNGNQIDCGRLSQGNYYIVYDHKIATYAHNTR
jgi:hypothetical protein